MGILSFFLGILSFRKSQAIAWPLLRRILALHDVYHLLRHVQVDGDWETCQGAVNGWKWSGERLEKCGFPTGKILDSILEPPKKTILHTVRYKCIQIETKSHTDVDMLSTSKNILFESV